MDDTWCGRKLSMSILPCELVKLTLTSVCLVAALGIMFEGYDQGVMSGVNISPSYIVGNRPFPGERQGRS